MFSRYRAWLQTRKPQPIRRRPRLRLEVEPLENRLLLSGASALGVHPDLIAALPQQTAGPMGYTPAQLRHAYGFDQISGLPNNDYNNAGKGQTIAIVDAYNDPNLRSDTQQFDEYFNILGAAGNAADTSFLRIVNQNGGAALPAPANLYVNWNLEVCLDVQWAHAIAPGANILLVEANRDSDQDVNAAVQYAENQPNVCVISMSYGDGTEWASQSLEDAVFTTPVGHQGVTFVSASGDGGAPPQWQAVSPNILAVGGTTLPADQNGNPDRSLETGWSLGSDAGPPLYNPYIASTGGISSVEAAPAYQASIQAYLNAQGYPSGGYRANPDVAYNADPNTGVPVYDSLGQPPGTDFDPVVPPWGLVGGTSAGAPQWSALIAIADQARAAAGEGTLDGPSQLLPSLYQIAQTDPRAFQNISTGTNGYNAGPGYNLITGLGTPNAQFLVPDLVNAYSTPTAPATVYWTGDAGDNSWNSPGNWSFVDPAVHNVPQSVLPGPNNNVVIDVQGATINHAAISYDTIRSLTVTAPFVTLNLVGGTLDLSGGGTLGTFQADQPGDVVNLGGATSAVGGVLKDATVTAHTVLTVPASTEGTVDGGVLNGSVQAGAASTVWLEGSWINNGTIAAGAGSTVVLGSYWSAYRKDPTAQAGAWVNNGTITVNDATVELGGWLTWTATSLNSLNLSTDEVELLGTLDNFGRTLTLSPGQTSRSGSWALAGGRIDGGTIATVGSAALIATYGAPNPTVAPFYYAWGNMLDGVTLDGTLDMSAPGTGAPAYYGAYVAVVDGLTLNAPLDLSGSYATLQVNDASPLILNANLDVSGTYAALSFNDGGSVTSGPGVPGATIDLSGANAAFSSFTGSSLASYVPTYPTVTLGRGVTISGSTSSSHIVGPIDNLGTIEQNGPGDLTVHYGLVNDGSIRVRNGGVLTLEGYPSYLNATDAPWSNNADGTITATQGATLNLYDNWTNHGVIRVDSSSTVSLGSPVTDSLTYSSTAGYLWNSSGLLAIAPGATINLGDYFSTDDFENHFRPLGVNLNLSQYKVNLIGTLDNSPADNPLTSGNLILDRATGSLYLAAGVVAGGTITTGLSNDLIATNAGYTYDYSNGFAVTATAIGYVYEYSNPSAIGGGALNSVTLDGVLDMHSIPAATATVQGGLTLNGVLALTGPGAALDFGSGGLSNAGMVVIGAGASVSVGAGDYTQSGGSTLVNGTLEAANVSLDGGVLSGDGTIQANVVNAALLVPGDPFGTLTVQGNYTQTASGELLIPIAGPSQYGQLAVTGSATLDGTLVVSLGDSYVPAVGTSFPILTFANYTGGFTTEVGLVLPHQRFLKPAWDTDDLTLTVTD